MAGLELSAADTALALLARSVRVEGSQLDRVWARGRVPGQAERRALWEPRSEYLTCIRDSRRDPRGSMFYKDLSGRRNWPGQRQAGVFQGTYTGRNGDGA